MFDRQQGSIHDAKFTASAFRALTSVLVATAAVGLVLAGGTAAQAYAYVQDGSVADSRASDSLQVQ